MDSVSCGAYWLSTIKGLGRRASIQSPALTATDPTASGRRGSQSPGLLFGSIGLSLNRRNPDRAAIQFRRKREGGKVEES